MIKYTPSGQTYSNLAFFNFISKNELVEAISYELRHLTHKNTQGYYDKDPLKSAKEEFNNAEKEIVNLYQEKYKANPNQNFFRDDLLAAKKEELVKQSDCKYKEAYCALLSAERKFKQYLVKIIAFVDCFIKHKKNILEGKEFCIKRENLKNSSIAKAYEDCHFVEKKAIEKFFGTKYRALRDSNTVMKFLKEHINVKVCLYCNINYTYAVEDKAKGEEGEKFLYELDHFYPKSEYPWLALSLWNLIPSCHTCNSSYKGTKELNTHPYKEKISERFSFTLKPTLRTTSIFFFTEDNIGIEFKEGNSQKKEGDSQEKDNIKVLGLEERYNQHKDVVIDLFKKSQMYSEARIQELYRTFKNSKNEEEKSLFNNEEEIKNLVFSCVPEEEFHNH